MKVKEMMVDETQLTRDMEYELFSRLSYIFGHYSNEAIAKKMYGINSKYAVDIAEQIKVYNIADCIANLK